MGLKLGSLENFHNHKNIGKGNVKKMGKSY